MLFRLKDPIKGVLCVQIEPGTPEEADLCLDYKHPVTDGVVNSVIAYLESDPWKKLRKGSVRSRALDFDGRMFLFPWKCWPVPEGYR